MDDCSTDGTYEKARQLATRVEQRRSDTMGAQRAYSLSLCRGEWVLWIDSDEMVTPGLADEIRRTLDSGRNLPDAFKVRRRWHYPTVWGSRGFHYLNQVHLFRRLKGGWDPETLIHTRVRHEGRAGQLRGIIEHWPWRDLKEHLTRVVKYSKLNAQGLVRQGKRGNAIAAITHGFWRLIKFYILKGGFRFGSAGFFNSFLGAIEPFLKYAYLWELRQQQKGQARGSKASQSEPTVSTETASKRTAGEDSGRIQLSGLVVCQNNIDTIERCLKSLAFCDEVVVVDGFSTDGTYEAAKRLAARVAQRKYDRIGAQRAYSLSLCRGEWVLCIDSDEMVTPELAAEIRKRLDGEGDLPVAFGIRRKWHYPTSWGTSGYYYLRQVHLFRRDKGSWDADKIVGPTVRFEGKRGALKGIIEHWPWYDLEDMVLSRIRYAGLGPRELAAKGRRCGALTALLHGAWRFFRHYVIKGAFMRGSAGFFFSFAIALEPFLKYAGLWEINRQRAAEQGVVSSKSAEEA